MPTIHTTVSAALKKWLQECARREARSEAQVIRRIMESAMAQGVPGAASPVGPTKKG